MRRQLSVIASAATCPSKLWRRWKQSILTIFKNGLPRRFAPRNDGYKIILIIAVFLIAGCGGKSNNTDTTEIITAELKPITKTFYFNGIVKPLSVVHVAAPMEGVVEKKLFRYGQAVKKDELLLTINSSKLETDYQTALLQYLKARDKLTTAKAKFVGTQELMKHELLSKVEFDTEKQSLGDQEFEFLQAQIKLEDLAKRGADFKIDPSIKDINEIEKALRKEVKIQSMIAPKAGIVLFPIKTEGSGSSGDNASIEAGSQVKQGQVLLTIGDLSGITTEIQVTEMDIHQIKTGQKVTLTGPAFPDMILHGKIAAVGSQAKTTSGGAGSPPTFTVEVVIPTVTEEQRKKIHVGMSAKIGLTLEYPAAILLPIKAIMEKNGEPWVKIQDPKTKKTKEIPVKTGKTTVNDVVIESGVKAGDKIIIESSSKLTDSQIGDARRSW